MIQFHRHDKLLRTQHSGRSHGLPPVGLGVSARAFRPSSLVPRRGFTIVEILVVIGLMAFLVAISVTVATNLISGAKESATSTTIIKIQGLMEQRIEAFDRWLQEGGRLDDLTRRKRRELRRLRQGFDDPGVAEVLVRKDQLRATFPQRFAEMTDSNNEGIPDEIANDAEINFAPGNHRPQTESAEILYRQLTRQSIFGLPPVDADQFSSSEVKDTDKDGLPEFVDAWERPLRFYRWPTRLIKPFGIAGPDGDPSTNDAGTIQRKLAGLLMEGLPAAPPGAAGTPQDPLNRDPDEPIGDLEPLLAIIGPNQFEGLFHTPDTFHQPLIVSAGLDGELGLFEPVFREDQNGNGVLDQGEDTNGNGRLDYGTLAQPTPQVLNSSDGGALNDNLTNRNRRAGGI